MGKKMYLGWVNTNILLSASYGLRPEKNSSFWDYEEVDLCLEIHA
jgi:hypothetical protein